MVVLDSLSLGGVCIYKPSLISEIPVLIELVEAQFESKEWDWRPQKKAIKEKVLSKAPNNGILKACFRLLLLDTCSSRGEQHGMYYFSCLDRKNRFGIFCINRCSCKERQEILQAQEKLVIRVESSRELEML